MDSVLNCLVTDKLDPGEYSEKFIKTAKERLGFDYGVTLRNPIIALETAIACLGLNPGEIIALSALSPAWAYKAISAKGLKALWLDVDISNAAMNSTSKDKIKQEGAKAVYLAQPWGIIPEPGFFSELDIPVIEDASYSIGTNNEGQKAGTLGTFCLIGLEPACAVTAGGGSLLYATGKREGQVLKNYSENLLAEERMTDMNSALALSQLKDLDKFLAKRKELTALYIQSAARAHKKLLASSGDEEPCYFGCVVVFDSTVKDARTYAKKKGVDTTMAFDNTCAALGLVPEGLCPNASSIVNRTLAFPLNQRIGKTEAQKIARVLATLP